MDLRAKCRSTVLYVVSCTEDISGLQVVQGFWILQSSVDWYHRIYVVLE